MKEITTEELEKTIWVGEGKELLKEEKTKRIEAEKKLKEITAQQRRTQIEAANESKIARIARRTTSIIAEGADVPLSNLDSVMGGTSYVFFTFAVASFSKSDYISGVCYFIFSALFCAAKYQLPVGKLGGWMRKETKVTKGIEKVIENVRETIIK